MRVPREKGIVVFHIGKRDGGERWKPHPLPGRRIDRRCCRRRQRPPTVPHSRTTSLHGSGVDVDANYACRRLIEGPAMIIYRRRSIVAIIWRRIGLIDRPTAEKCTTLSDLSTVSMNCPINGAHRSQKMRLFRNVSLILTDNNFINVYRNCGIMKVGYL